MSYLWYWPAGGWDFDEWRKHHDWEPIRSEQSGRAEPLPLVGSGADALRQWEKAAPGWRRICDELLGTLTDRPPAHLRWEFLGDELLRDAPDGAYTLRRLRYRLTDHEWGYAWLLTPRAPAGPRPAVLALHQTSPTGKAEVVGLERIGADDSMPYAAELAERGFVVLAPDAIAFGERQAAHSHGHYRSAADFFAAHPDGSVMAKMAYDTSRAVDLLAALPGVDVDRVGCIGHSHGAYGTLFAMLADDRIKAGVLSCGLNLLRHDPGVDRWWRRTALIPRLGWYEDDIAQTPIDVHHWLALLAPRPVMVVAGTRDRIFPNVHSLPRWLELARDVYTAYGAGNALTGWIFDGEHQFPAAARRDAYLMLTEALS